MRIREVMFPPLTGGCSTNLCNVQLLYLCFVGKWVFVHPPYRRHIGPHEENTGNTVIELSDEAASILIEPFCLMPFLLVPHLNILNCTVYNFVEHYATLGVL